MTGLVIPRWVLICMGFAIGLVISTWRYDAEISHLKANYATELQAIAEANVRAMEEDRAKHEAESARLNKLEATTSKDLSHALSENNDLRAKYSVADNERKRLRINAARVSDTYLPASPTADGTTSVDYGTTVELSAAAGSAVWDLRESIIKDNAKLIYLQGRVCAQEPELPVCANLKL